MFDQIRSFFTGGGKEEMLALIKDGAQVVDVRSRGEFASGHLEGSINIPLNELSTNLTRINKARPVIVCCASGMRSASAKGMLQSRGFVVHNGGSWFNLEDRRK